MSSRTVALRVAICLGLTAAGPLRAQQDEPLSAIDWLSDSVRRPPAAAVPPPPRADEAPVADSATSPAVTVTPLDSGSPDPVGLLSAQMTGLPRSLWSHSPEATLVALVQAQRVETLPAAQDLLATLMLAEADAPLDAGADGALFLARIDKLLDMGAIDPAQALLEEAGPVTPELYRRWFDVSLLTGTEDTACDALRDQPGLAPTYPARVFCLARGGDWTAAALTLNTARALEEVSQAEDALLSRFLDPDLFADEPVLPPPDRVSPLVFRMREAIGEGLATAPLPRAFAHADLRSTAPWRAQIEAAERLARSGSAPENMLLGLYTRQVPAASGGVWDRAAAIQRFDEAMTQGGADTIADTLPDAWAAMRRAGTEVPFARLYGARLAQAGLDGAPAGIAVRLAMLSPDVARLAPEIEPRNPQERLWRAVAIGDLAGIEPASPEARAVVDAFGGAEAPAPVAALLDQDRLGEALLRTTALIQQGMGGETSAMRDAIAVLIAADMTETARAVALQFLILGEDE